MNSLAVNSPMPKQLEIGTKFETGYGVVWTIGGYVYYEDDLWYVCFDDNGNQRDEHAEDIKDWLEYRGAK